jgi:agmatine deiminase
MTSMAERFVLPAEWEPHEATWIAWPHNAKDWPGKLHAVQWAFAEMVRAIVPGETVRLIVRDEEHRRHAHSILKRAGVEGNVSFLSIATERSWTRDMGPIFLRRGGRKGPRVVGNFAFTGWAKYQNYTLDDRVAATAAKKLRMDTITPTAGGKPLVLEGGAIDVNGAGDLLTTERCLLDHSSQPRNEHLDRRQLSEALKQYLGVRNIHWLEDGIVGDDTGGHIDDLARFVNASTIIVAAADPADDPENAPTLADARQRLEATTLADGNRPTVVSLPMPRPLYFDSIRLPASYANFYIANAAVLVPTFNDPADRIALGILGELFPDRQIVGIHAVDLVWGFGAIHCLTQQQPIA